MSNKNNYRWKKTDRWICQNSHDKFWPFENGHDGLYKKSPNRNWSKNLHTTLKKIEMARARVWRGKFGTNPSEMGEKSLHFPAKCVETLHGQDCNEAKKGKILVKFLDKWGSIWQVLLEPNYPNRIWSVQFPPPRYVVYLYRRQSALSWLKSSGPLASPRPTRRSSPWASKTAISWLSEAWTILVMLNCKKNQIKTGTNTIKTYEIKIRSQKNTPKMMYTGIITRRNSIWFSYNSFALSLPYIWALFVAPFRIFPRFSAHLQSRLKFSFAFIHLLVRSSICYSPFFSVPWPSAHLGGLQ